MKWLFIILILFSCTGTKESLVPVRLDGSKSFDPDGQIIKYEWRQIGGKSFPISNPKSSITVTNVKEGTFTWELTVIDNDGLKDKDTTVLIVRKK